ncbi:hypothetical protein N7540_007415 [Penicillium herquei]|nr:hypothetical protein N7540_007415 [Penicillium herquei]
MADPISVTSLVLDVGHILARLIKYAKTVQIANVEIRRLSEELFALKGILEHVVAHTPGHLATDEDMRMKQESEFDYELMTKVLHATNEFLQSIIIELNIPKTGLQRVTQKLKWPFTQERVKDQLAHLERIKSWLVLVLVSDQSLAYRSFQEDISDLISTLKRDLQIREQERHQTADRELFQWIAPVNPASSHLRALDQHQPGTSGWFVDGILKKFLGNTDGKQILFISGKSGSGKTTLLAQAINSLSSVASQDSLCVAYFYCTIGNLASQDIRHILGSLVAQLSGRVTSVLEDIRQHYAQLPEGQAHRPPIQTATLESGIVKGTSGGRKVIIMLDAINESHDMTLLEKSLLRISKSSSNVQVIVTTTETIRSAGDPIVSILNIRSGIQEDIRSFIGYRLRSDEILKRLAPSFQSEIESTILQKADGSFRWVQLSLDDLSAKRSKNAMRQALETLPGTLRETYVSKLEEIAREDWEIARNALFWLSFAKEPLRLSALNEIVVLDETKMALDEDAMIVSPQILLRICQGLISQDRNGFVSLEHPSVKEFLTSDWIKSSRVQYFSLDSRMADLKAMHICLTYLCLNNFKGGCLTYLEKPSRLFKDHPFMLYAANLWPYHGVSCNFGNDHQYMIQKLFSTRSLPGGGNYGVWVQALLRSRDAASQIDPAAIQRTHPLYYAASFGMVPVVKAIIENDLDLDIDAPGGRVGATPLWIASVRFNFEVVEILLQEGADPEISDPGTWLNVLELAELQSHQGLQAILARAGNKKRQRRGNYGKA